MSKLSKEDKTIAINFWLSKTNRCLKKSKLTVKLLDELIEKEKLDCYALIEEYKVIQLEKEEKERNRIEVLNRIRQEKHKVYQDKIDSLSSEKKQMLIDKYNSNCDEEDKKMDKIRDFEMNKMRQMGMRVEAIENGFIANGVHVLFNHTSSRYYDDTQLYHDKYMEYIDELNKPKKIKLVIIKKS